MLLHQYLCRKSKNELLKEWMPSDIGRPPQKGVLISDTFHRFFFSSLQIVFISMYSNIRASLVSYKIYILESW